MKVLARSSPTAKYFDSNRIGEIIMSEAEVKISRREQILQAVVHMLEINPGGKITTANIAKTEGFQRPHCIATSLVKRKCLKA